MDQPGWTAIIINYNGASYLGPCLSALESVDVPPAAVIVVDNASTDDSLAELIAYPRVELLAQPRNLGFAGGANAGLRATTTDVALLLNPDVEVAPDFGFELLAVFARYPRLGAAGALLTYPGSARIQHAGGIIERPLMTTRHRGYGDTTVGAYQVAADVDFVTGGAMALRTESVRAVGGFDELLAPVYYEDVDLCVRMRDAGWRVMFTPSLRGEHHEGVTLKREASYYRHLHRNRLRFALKHMSHAEWADGFVPAELARLRYELASTHDASESETSGAGAIEAVLRGLDGPDAWNASLALPGWPVSIADIDVARTLIDVTGSRPRSRLPLVGWLRNKVKGIGPRWYVDPAFEKQHAFNAAVVRALDAHERRHREQTAALLLLALDALGRLRTAPELETGERQRASAPES
ncbi:MAG TPA: glycosyltransferase family 2 protein [Thermomicrobiales bacterium]|nr:glycosyltransferase family 2 protein [Thermomicrobiales bacterium]